MTHGGFRSLRSLHPCLPGRAGTTSSASASSPSLALGSLSPSGFSRAAAGGLLVLSCRRPLRGALVRCGGVSGAVLGAGAPAARSGSVTRSLVTSDAAASYRPGSRPWRALLREVGPRSAGAGSAAAGVAAWRPSAVSPPRSLAGWVGRPRPREELPIAASAAICCISRRHPAAALVVPACRPDWFGRWRLSLRSARSARSEVDFRGRGECRIGPAAPIVDTTGRVSPAGAGCDVRAVS